MQNLKTYIIAATAVLFLACSKQKRVNSPGNLVPLTVDQDPALSSITINNIRLHAEAHGPADSTLIVCLHGGPGNDYRHLLTCKDLVNDGYRLVFYDQRGSGLSQRLSKEFYRNQGSDLLDGFCQELEGVINHYKTRPGQKVILLGHSWGAMLATSFAGKYPDKISGLIICEPGGLTWEDQMEYVKQAQALNIWSESLNDLTYNDQFITATEDEHQVLDYKLALLGAKNEITGEDNTLPESIWRHGAVMLSSMIELGKKYKPDFRAGIDQYTKPVLFIYSQNNKAYPDAWAAKQAGYYRQATLLKITDAGHNGIFLLKNAWTTQTLPGIRNYLKSL
jgi:proline iminopeptidase